MNSCLFSREIPICSLTEFIVTGILQRISEDETEISREMSIQAQTTVEIIRITKAKVLTIFKLIMCQIDIISHINDQITWKIALSDEIINEIIIKLIQYPNSDGYSSQTQKIPFLMDSKQQKQYLKYQQYPDNFQIMNQCHSNLYVLVYQNKRTALVTQKQRNSLICYTQLCKNQTIILSQINYSRPYLQIIIKMDYDARKDSLLSEQQSEKVEIYFSIRNLSANSVYLEVYLQETNRPRKKIMQTKTEKPYNSVIDFPQSAVLEYFFEVRQKLIVQVYASSGSSKQLLGTSEATVGEIFNGRAKGVGKNIQFQSTNIGLMNLRSEKIERGSNKYVQFDLIGRNIDVGSYFLCFGNGGAHWKLYKVKNNEQYLLHQSETRDGKNNRFAHLKINEKRLCNNNPKQPIIFRFFSDSGSMIGQVRTDLASLSEGKLKYTLMKKNSEAGVFILQNFRQTIKYDFTDYLVSGMQMAMVACIDFTASNGIQNQPTSLHYVSPTKKSHYQEALNEVCNIVLDYDNDKLVPTFGFGAKVNLPNFSTGGKVHHCFPINGSETNPNLFQLAGILKGYRECLPYLSFSGPTFFAPLLRQAMNVCSNMQKQLKEYMILLILTDGIIHDKQQVKDLLVKCGKLPLSVIIIGIGNGQDWGAMHELDDDDCQMTDFQGNKTQRDLVQFVQFSKHNNNGVELAREVLEELPRQVEQYHQLIKLTPQAYKKNLISDVMYQENKYY